MMYASRLAISAGVLSFALGGASAAHAQVTSTTAPAPDSALALQAQAEAKNHRSTYIDLNGGLGYSSNSYSGSSGGGGGFGRISATAVHSVVSNRASTNLSAYVENQTYFSGGGSNQVFDLNGSTRYTIEPRLDVFASVGLSGDIGGQLFNRFTSVPSAPPTSEAGNPLPPIDVLDPNLIGLNRRQYRASANGGFSYKISPRDFVNASVGYQKVFFSSGGSGLDYSTVSGSLGWNRVLSERKTVGLRVTAQRTDYRGGGDSTIISPTVTGTAQLSEGWSLSGAVGLSFVNNNTLGSSERSTNFTANASLCKSLETGSICAAAARASQASVGQSVVTSTTASLSYSRVLGARDTLRLAADYGRSSGDNNVLIADRSTYYGAHASYDRKISARLSAGAEGGVRRVTRTGGSTPTDVSGSIFLRYRLGDLQ